MENLAPLTINGWTLHSILDDSDPCYHSDALTHQTPAQERRNARRVSLETAATVPSRPTPQRRTP